MHPHRVLALVVVAILALGWASAGGASPVPGTRRAAAQIVRKAGGTTGPPTNAAGASAAPSFPVVAGQSPVSVLPGPLAPGVVAIQPVPQLAPTDQQIRSIVDKKTVCPFIGAAVNSKLFPIFGTLESPYTLASSVRDLCNSGPGSDFGTLLYTIALVNLPGPLVTGGANPGLGYTTLSLAGSIAAHRGHSGILSAMSATPNAGRFSPEQWARLNLRAVGGFITGEALAHWVAENMLVDPLSTPWNVVTILEHIGLAIAKGVPVLMADKFHASHPVGGALQPAGGPALKTANDLKPIREGVMAALASNLFNAAAEMAFITTVFEHSPKTRRAASSASPLSIQISMDDMELMFVQRKLPAGFTSWPKLKADFSKIIGPMALTAAKALVAARLKGINSPAKATPMVGKI